MSEMLTDEEIKKVIPGYIDYEKDAEGEFDWSKPKFKDGSVTQVMRAITQAQATHSLQYYASLTPEQVEEKVHGIMSDFGSEAEICTLLSTLLSTQVKAAEERLLERIKEYLNYGREYSSYGGGGIEHTKPKIVWMDIEDWLALSEVKKEDRHG